MTEQSQIERQADGADLKARRKKTRIIALILAVIAVGFYLSVYFSVVYMK